VLEVALRFSGFVVVSLQEHRNMLSLKKKGAFRILCLGESTTRNQYPRFLEEALNQGHPGISFSVIDQGLAGATTASILNRLESNLNSYLPELVVVMMGANDYGKHMPYEVSIFSPRALILLGSLRTYKLASLLWLRLVTRSRQLGAESTKGHLLGEVSSQEEDFRRCIEGNPKNTACYEGLGKAYAVQGEFSQAERVLTACIERNPGDTACYAGLGEVYGEQKKFSQAEEILKKGIALKPQDTACYIVLGAVYKRQRNFPQAEQVLTRAVALNPHDSKCYAKLGSVCGEQGHLPQAEEIFTKCIELNPGDSPCYAGLGGVYSRQGKLAKAEELFKKAMTLSPENDIIYGKLAVIYEAKKQEELAEAYYRKANASREKEYNPDTVHNYRRLKEILDTRRITLVCVQYPMRGISSLKKIFAGGSRGIIFVDNERIFKDAVKKEGYEAYFIDTFGGDFGHCTEKGNRLLAENIADTILREIFGK
jgi:Flp pilus assembly protein TadD/lysophospholipase L1-like esterase